MKGYLAPALLILAGCASATGAAEAPVAVEVADGYIAMDTDRRLWVVQDSEPNVGEFIRPSDPSYRAHLELVHGLVPGQRKRMPKRYLRYEESPDGSYGLFVWAEAPNVQSEPATRLVRVSDSSYSCYNRVLKRRGVGEHYITEREWRQISSCLEDRT
jgi:hypothetical protein